MTNKNRLLKANDAEDDFISRAELAVRWGCHIETLKRREKQGSLHPLRFSTRMVRYPLREVRALEREAGGNDPSIDATQDLRWSTGSRPMKQKQRRNLSTSQPSPDMECKGVVVELTP
jgi:hypothetical protein